MLVGFCIQMTFKSLTFFTVEIDVAEVQKKIEFSVKDLFCKCDHVRVKLPILSYLLKKSLMENFMFLALSCLRIFILRFY